jgi:hypothetical protein
MDDGKTVTARIISCIGGRYTVDTDGGERMVETSNNCQLQGFVPQPVVLNLVVFISL